MSCHRSLVLLRAVMDSEVAPIPSIADARHHVVVGLESKVGGDVMRLSATNSVGGVED